MGIPDYRIYDNPPVRPEDQAAEIARVMDLAEMDEQDPRFMGALAKVTNLAAKYALRAAIGQARAALARAGRSKIIEGY